MLCKNGFLKFPLAHHLWHWLSTKTTTTTKGPSDFKVRLLVQTCAGNQGTIRIQIFITKLRTF